LRSKVKKICFVIGSLERGGAEIHLTRVLPQLDKNHFEARVFCFVRKGELAPVLEKQGVKVIEPELLGALAKRSIFFKPILLVVSILFFLLFLIRFRPHLVHFFLPSSYLLLGPVSLLHWRSQKVMSRRSMNVYQRKYPPIVRRIELWLHNKMDCVVGNSQRVINELRIDEGVTEEKLHLIYNGISIDEGSITSRDRIRKSLGLSFDGLVMTVVANLIPYKGHIDLLEACKLLSRRDWELVIVGRDSAGIQKRLEYFTLENNLQNNVHFIGPRNDVSDLWAASDIGLLVSHEEGFSNALLEGMSANLPMIVTSVGGNDEAVINGETGIVVPPKNPEALSKAIERLLGDAELRLMMGKKAGERVREIFSLQSCVDQYETLYKRLLSNG